MEKSAKNKKRPTSRKIKVVGNKKGRTSKASAPKDVKGTTPDMSIGHLNTHRKNLPK